MRIERRIPRAIALCLLAACGSSGEDGATSRAEALRQARADSVAEAEAMFDPATFDSISWVAPDSAVARGQTVWSFSCQRCHGFMGRGDGDLATEHHIDMPDLTRTPWEYDGDLAGIRHRIFVGHETEMPNWGLHGLAYRDIDAVAHYILEKIR